jgi:hypothetical protein
MYLVLLELRSLEMNGMRSCMLLILLRIIALRGHRQKNVHFPLIILIGNTVCLFDLDLNLERGQKSELAMSFMDSW